MRAAPPAATRTTTPSARSRPAPCATRTEATSIASTRRAAPGARTSVREPRERWQQRSALARRDRLVPLEHLVLHREPADAGRRVPRGDLEPRLDDDVLRAREVARQYGRLRRAHP